MDHSDVGPRDFSHLLPPHFRPGTEPNADKVTAFIQRRETDRSVLAYTIRCIRSAEGWQSAIACLNALSRCTGVYPNNHAFYAAMAACEKSGRPDKAVDLYEHLLQHGPSYPGGGLHPDVLTASAAIAACGRAGRPDRARELFDRFLASPGDAPPRTSIADVYNAMMIAHEATGQRDRVFELLEKLRKAGHAGDGGLQPDAASYDIAIRVAGEQGDWKQALDLFMLLRREGSRFPRKISPTVGSFTSAMRALGQCDRHAELLEVFRLWESEGARQRPPHMPGLQAFIAAIQACARMEPPDADKALRLARQAIQDGPGYPLPVRASQFMIASTIEACSKAGRDDGVVEMLDYLHAAFAQGRRDLLPDASAYTTAISTCLRAGNPHRALEQFRRLEQVGPTLPHPVLPRPIDYNAAMTSYVKIGQPAAALEILRATMERARNGELQGAANHHLVSKGITICGKAGLVDEALALFDEVRRDGGTYTEPIVPDLTMYHKTLNTCDAAGRSADAIRLLEDLRTTGPTFSPPVHADAACWNAAMGACLRGGQPEKALELFETLCREGPAQQKPVLPDQGHFSRALEACELSRQQHRYADLLLLGIHGLQGRPESRIFHPTLGFDRRSNQLDFHEDKVFAQQRAMDGRVMAASAPLVRAIFHVMLHEPGRFPSPTDPRGNGSPLVGPINEDTQFVVGWQGDGVVRQVVEDCMRTPRDQGGPGWTPAPACDRDGTPNPGRVVSASSACAAPPGMPLPAVLARRNERLQKDLEDSRTMQTRLDSQVRQQRADGRLALLMTDGITLPPSAAGAALGRYLTEMKRRGTPTGMNVVFGGSGTLTGLRKGWGAPEDPRALLDRRHPQGCRWSDVAGVLKELGVPVEPLHLGSALLWSMPEDEPRPPGH